MPPTFLLADLYATSALAGRAHSALPGAPVQPHVASARARVRHLATAIPGTVVAVTSNRAARTAVRVLDPCVVRTLPVNAPRHDERHGEGDAADDRRPRRRQPHDGVQRLLPPRSALPRAARGSSRRPMTRLRRARSGRSGAGPGTTGAVGVLLTDSLRVRVHRRGRHHFLGAVADGLGPTARAHVAVLQRARRRRPRPRRADGRAFVYSCDTSRPGDWLIRRKLPLVYVDQDRWPASRASTSTIAPGRAAAQHLVDLGHRRIGILTCASTVPRDRRGPVRGAVGTPSGSACSAGSTPWAEPASTRPSCSRRTARTARLNAAATLLAVRAGPTAVLCFSDCSPSAPPGGRRPRAPGTRRPLGGRLRRQPDRATAPACSRPCARTSWRRAASPRRCSPRRSSSPRGSPAGHPAGNTCCCPPNSSFVTARHRPDHDLTPSPVRQNGSVRAAATFGPKRAPPGSLAQLAEHRAFNPQVQGSSPWRPTADRSLTSYQR